jgi:hypothetical protein
MLKETKAYLAWIKYDLDIISYVLTWKIMLTRVYVFYYNCIACHKSYTNLRCDKTFINILYSHTHSLASTYTLILKSTTEQRWNQQYPLILHHSTSPFTTYVSPPTKQLPHHTTTSQQINRIYSLLSDCIARSLDSIPNMHPHAHIHTSTIQHESLSPHDIQHHNTTSSLHTPYDTSRSPLTHLPLPPLDLTATSLLLYYKRRPMHMTCHQNDMLTGKASLTPVITALIKSLTTQSGMWTHHQSAVISAWWCRKRSGEQKVNELYMCRKEARCACVESRESSEWEMDSETAWKIRLICGSKRFRTVIHCLGALTNKIYGPENE